MKKVILSILVLLSYYGINGQVISSFTWEGPTRLSAAVGPDAVSVGDPTSGTSQTLAAFKPTGNGTPNGLAPGSYLNPTFCCTSFCPTHASCTTRLGVDLNFTVPTNATFQRGSMSFKIDFMRRNNEVAANFFTWIDGGGVPIVRFGSDQSGIVYIQYAVTSTISPFYELIGSPDNGSGGYNLGTEGETASNTGNGTTWYTHTFTYDSISGIGEVWRNDFGTPRWSSAWGSVNKVRPGESLYSINNVGSVYQIGTRCDGMGSSQTVFDNAEISAPIPLPASLIYFEGENVGFETNLTWETGEESNNEKFHVERYDTELKEWVLVGVVSGSGTTDGPKQYSLVDRNPKAGMNTYVLRQFDYNGNNRPMGKTEVYFEGFGNRVLEIYPNPVTKGKTLNVRFESSEDKMLEMDIVDLEGRVIQSFTQSVYGGVNTLEFSTDGLSGGMYFFRLNTGTKNAMKKFVVTK